MFSQKVWELRSKDSKRPVTELSTSFRPSFTNLHLSMSWRLSRRMVLLISSIHSAKWSNCGTISSRQRRKYDSERSEEHTSELQSLMRISYAVFCLKKKTN